MCTTHKKNKALTHQGFGESTFSVRGGVQGHSAVDEGADGVDGLREQGYLQQGELHDMTYLRVTLFIDVRAIDSPAGSSNCPAY